MTALQTALRGETPPLVTPFDGTDVDHDALASVVEHVRAGGTAEAGAGEGNSTGSDDGPDGGDDGKADAGVDALFPLGTTGEFASLTASEQRGVIETVVEESGDLPVVAGVSETAVDEVVERATAAEAAGANAAVLTPPYFHGASGPRGNHAFFEAVAERSPLPLLLYNIPQHVGASLEVETVAALAERDDVLGIKDSSGDLTYDLALAEATPDDFLVLQGYDTLLVPGQRMGLDGGVNALANVVPEAFATMTSEPESEDARRASAALSELFGVCLEVGFATGVKAGLVERGVIERDDLRPPLEAVGEEHRRRVAAGIESILDAV